MEYQHLLHPPKRTLKSFCTLRRKTTPGTNMKQPDGSWPEEAISTETLTESKRLASTLKVGKTGQNKSQN